MGDNILDNHNNINGIGNLCLIQKMKKTRVTIEDIVFWIIILFIIGIALWLLHGSPTDTGAIISIGLAFASSELLLWKKFYGIDKRIALSFMKLRSDFDKKFIQIENNINKRLITIENTIEKNNLTILNKIDRIKK